jgi:hypothetical protein
MALCSECLFYDLVIDDINRSFNDIDAITNHFCSMYADMIPNGVFNGPKDCTFFAPKEE